jgi:dipeptidyl aminopeptidase/acylaminoacyl peptidase
MKRLIPIAICLILSTSAFAQTVSVKDGNIQFADKSGETSPVTTGGRDSEPNLSPDGKLVAFVRASDRKVPTGAGEDSASEIWIVGSDGKNGRKIVEPKTADKTENILALLTAPQFSSDGKSVFFETTAWATSDAIHVVDVSTKKEHFVCDGSALEVIREGEYRDHLLVTKHKYFVGGGSYDWVWLVKADGKEVGPVGEDASNFKDLYLKKN